MSRWLWRTHREKLLYLVIGGWNTLFQYGVFSLCWYLLSPHWPPAAILLTTYVIGSVNGFLGFRFIVFGASGRHPLLEYLKYQTVYLPLLGLNLVALTLLLRYRIERLRDPGGVRRVRARCGVPGQQVLCVPPHSPAAGYRMSPAAH